MKNSLIANAYYVEYSERRDCGHWRTSQLQDSLWWILWSLLLPLPLRLCMGAPIGSMGTATGARHSIHSQSKARNGGIWTRDIDESFHLKELTQLVVWHW